MCGIVLRLGNVFIPYQSSSSPSKTAMPRYSIPGLTARMRLGFCVWVICVYAPILRLHTRWHLTFDRRDLICNLLVQRIVEISQRYVVYRSKLKRRAETRQHCS